MSLVDGKKFEGDGSNEDETQLDSTEEGAPIIADSVGLVSLSVGVCLWCELVLVVLVMFLSSPLHSLSLSLSRLVIVVGTKSVNVNNKSMRNCFKLEFIDQRNINNTRYIRDQLKYRRRHCQIMNSASVQYWSAGGRNKIRYFRCSE